VKKELEKESVSPDTTLKDYHKKIIDFIKEKGFITDKYYSELTQSRQADQKLGFQEAYRLGVNCKSRQRQSNLLQIEVGNSC
jgi:Uma2 family endonuclease